MLDLLNDVPTHPLVEVIWNFFPAYMFLPRTLIWFLNLVFFLPNLVARVGYVPWNTFFFPVYLMVMALTFFLN